MVVHFAQWGNSVALRIPNAFVREFSLEAGKQAELIVKDGALIVRPAGPVYSINDLVAGITAQNLHAETDTGPSVGNEIG
jgi:antitoxin MazE